jgi:hypothetical protein
LLGLFSNHDPSDLSPHSNWDYWCKPLAPGYHWHLYRSLLPLSLSSIFSILLYIEFDIFCWLCLRIH